MKEKAFALLLLVLAVPAVILLGLFTAAYAQTSGTSATPSTGQKSFDALKTLAGEWEGPVKLDPPEPGMQPLKPMHISMRITSRGNALVHEMQESGTALDPAKYDHPVTIFYLDADILTLVHYCDAGNRPRMVARKPDGKTLEFDFVDMSGGNQNGHMYHALFTLIDANHHSEDWTFMLPGDKPARGHFDLHCVLQ